MDAKKRPELIDSERECLAAAARHSLQLFKARRTPYRWAADHRGPFFYHSTVCSLARRGLIAVEAQRAFPTRAGLAKAAEQERGSA
ncbi:MAG: hypothetical protein KGL46_14380 [Hyphomicrobiales bacterium]|nr:hypothetical protein [Hyphomicrobiales bacterium]